MVNTKPVLSPPWTLLRAHRLLFSSTNLFQAETDKGYDSLYLVWDTCAASVIFTALGISQTSSLSELSRHNSAHFPLICRNVSVSNSQVIFLVKCNCTYIYLYNLSRNRQRRINWALW